MPAEISRTGQLAKNSMFGLLAWMLPILIGFFTTPILVHGLGTESYGLYAVITGFITYSFSFGIGKIAAKYVAEYKATGEIEKISPVVSATFLFSLAVGIFGTAALAALARLIVADVLLLEGPAAETATMGLYLACGISVAAMISQVYQFVLQGLQRFGAFLVLTNLSGVLLGVGNIIIVLSGRGILALLCWNIAVAAVVGLLFYIAAKRHLPELRLTFDLDSAAVKAVAGYGISIIFYQIFANVLFIFERAFIMRRFGAEALAFYSVPMMLAIYLHAFVGSFAAVLFPVINELLTDPARQIELYKKATKIILAVVAFVVTTFIFAGRAGLAVWINEEFSVNSYYLLVTHGVTFGLLGMLVIVWQIAEGFRQTKINAMLTAVWLIIAVPLMLATADRFGTEGIAISRLVAVSAAMPVIFLVEKRFLGRVFWGFWGAAVLRVALAAISAGLVERLIIENAALGWAGLTLCGLCGGLVFALILIFTGYLTRDERRLFTDLVGKRFRMAS